MSNQEKLKEQQAELDAALRFGLSDTEIAELEENSFPEEEEEVRKHYEAWANLPAGKAGSPKRTPQYAGKGGPIDLNPTFYTSSGLTRHSGKDLLPALSRRQAGGKAGPEDLSDFKEFNFRTIDS